MFSTLPFTCVCEILNVWIPLEEFTQKKVNSNCFGRKEMSGLSEKRIKEDLLSTRYPSRPLEFCTR